MYQKIYETGGQGHCLQSISSKQCPCPLVSHVHFYYGLN
ncbi:MAG: hypothetical protein H6Q68_2001 [Firmicutes bacterium]|nr:hypothetical protein [Bacillota bacterium]